MTFWEILLIIALVSFVIYIFGNEIYKRVKGKAVGDCECCAMSNKRKMKKLRKEIHKECQSHNKNK